MRDETSTDEMEYQQTKFMTEVNIQGKKKNISEINDLFNKISYNKKYEI